MSLRVYDRAGGVVRLAIVIMRMHCIVQPARHHVNTARRCSDPVPPRFERARRRWPPSVACEPYSEKKWTLQR